MRRACLVKEGLHGDRPESGQGGSLCESPLLVRGWKRPLFGSVPCMPTSHSITSVHRVAVEPLSTLGSGGCLQDVDSSQASDGRSVYEKREMQINGWNGLFSESRE